MNRILPDYANHRGTRRKISGDRSAARRPPHEAIVNGGVVTLLNRIGLPRFLGRKPARVAAPARAR